MEVARSWARVLVLGAVVICQLHLTAGLGFAPGYEYWYSLDSTTHLNEDATIHTTAKVGILPMNGSQQEQYLLCRLLVEDYDINIIQVPQNDSQTERPELSFSKRTLFELSEDGEVLSIYYETSENPSVLAAKKTLLNLLSSKLVISSSQIAKGQRWGYGTNETGHEGVHSAVYQAEPSNTHVHFVKTKTSKAPGNIKQAHVKKIAVHRESGLPQEFHIEDEFSTPKDSKLQGEGADPAFTTSVPVMSTQSKSKVILEDVRAADRSLMIGTLDNMEETTLEGVAEEPVYYNLTFAEETISTNVKCVLKHGDSRQSMTCFRAIVFALQRVSFDDLQTLVFFYKNRKAWIVIVDALGAASTDNSLYLLTNEVFLNPASTADEIMHGLVQLVRLDKCPSKLMLSELRWRAFEEPWKFPDEHVTNLVNDRTKLVVGAMVSMVMKCNQTWAQDVTRVFETLLGVHDPFHHRQMRSTMAQKDMRVHLSVKSVHIYALGNAGQTSSYDYFVSYLNTTESHMQLRFSAVEAVANYQHPEAARLLLQVALTDEEDQVRRLAQKAYKKHPHGGGDLQEFMEQKLYRYSNITDVTHKRMRRDALDVISRIWKGFEIKLVAPGIDWKKLIGGESAGASFGLIVQNKLDLKISALQGHFKVHVEDRAWATLHLGILNIHFDIFRAEICYKGKVEYDLNILAEFSLDDIKNLANIYDNYVKRIFDTIKNAITSFKTLIEVLNGNSIGDLWTKFIDIVTALPQSVKHWHKNARNTLKALENYVDLPPVYSKVKAYVARMMTLFNDIKTDVLTLYNAIINIVSTTLPWAWDQIKTAFNNIVDAFQNILRDPKTSIQNIGKAVIRVSTVIVLVIEAKDKILEANIFESDNRPYWLDFDQLSKGFVKDSTEVKDAVFAAIAELDRGSDGEEDEEAARFTGLSLKAMKRQALLEIWQTVDDNLLQGPLAQVITFLDPFVEIYKIFTETVNSIKKGWATLQNGYRKAKSFLNRIFGSKINKSFPRKYMQSLTCGTGFWKTSPNIHYEHLGVDLEAKIGAVVRAPFNGLIYNTGTTKRPQLTIIHADMDNTAAVLDNVLLYTHLNGTTIGGGDRIGTVSKPGWCVDGHIHFSMMKTNVSDEYINPSTFLEKRKMPLPKWIEECDHYKLVILGKTISAGMITKDPQVKDETPNVKNKPASSELAVPKMNSKKVGRRKRATTGTTGATVAGGTNGATKTNVTIGMKLTAVVNKVKAFISKLPTAGLNQLKDVLFNTDINDLTLEVALDFLADGELSGLKDKILTLLLKTQTVLNQETCSNPNALDDTELKGALAFRGKPTAGSREVLLKRYLESTTECFGLQKSVSDNIYCSYRSDCLGLSCCVDQEFFIYRHTETVFVQYDPCLGAVVLGVGKWSRVVGVSGNTNVENVEPVDTDVDKLAAAQLQVLYSVKQQDNIIKVSLAVRWCSTQSDECLQVLTVMTNAELVTMSCEDYTEQTAESTSPSSLQLDMTVAEVIRLVEISGLDEDEVNELTDLLREAFETWLIQQIEDAVAQIFGDEFELQDMCMNAFQLKFGPYKVVFFKSPPISFQAGPLTISFLMGVDGYYGADFSCTVCVLSMKATARVVPRLGSSIWGVLQLKLLIFAVELKLTGYVLTTSFPTKAEIEFGQFPMDVRARMDLELIPLKIELHIVIKITINLLFFSFEFTIFEKMVWGYTSPTITKNIFNLNNAAPDLSPPAFAFYSTATCRNCNNKRQRRQIEGTPQCVVYQEVGRDYTDPAYIIELDAEDDKSPVNMTYCVGTFVGGCDLVKDRELGSASTQSEILPTGVPLYFKVTARNSGGMAAYSQCELYTYDMTLPTGRVIPAYKTSSHPGELLASLLITEDSEITETLVSVGYGEDKHGFQVLDWGYFDTENDEDAANAGNDVIEKFRAGKEGKLFWEPFYSESHDHVDRCAERCLAYPKTKCQGFNYDYEASGLCELLDIVEGEVELQKHSLFYYYERRGIGEVAALDLQDLDMQHDKLVFFNVYAKNNLDFVNILSSEGVLIDLTAPTPGYIQNASYDETSVEPCTEFTPDYLHQRCSVQTPIPNYRYIIDGEGSRCVFTGIEPMVDETYTRANAMSAANWVGFHDNETGILLYLWSVGSEPCGSDIHPHDDPHKHLPHEDEWTHQGVSFPLDLPDGPYYVTVRAINKVEYGGPLAVTVCHNSPLIVDNTPPVINEIGDASYSEEEEEVFMTVDASDDLSLIKAAEFGLGRSPRDTYILSWQDIEEYSEIQYPYRIPDGIPVWPKVRVTNNVDLKTVGHSPKAIIYDASPPLPGEMYWGRYTGYHQLYESENDTLCLVWEGFNDPDSGISEYLIAVGTSPDTQDVNPYIPLPHTEASYCFTGLSLQHNTSYYASMIAFNGASDTKNVSATSQGILVDLTSPESGSVKDGLADEQDLTYSSDPAVIKASWEGFSDPESGLDKSRADVYRQLQGSTEATVVHQEHLDPNTDREMELHHMHFYHGDEVHVSYSVTNGAGSDSEARSDGFTVDLTEPVMHSLVDGPDTDVDMEYTSSLSELTATWKCEDAESGIVQYRFSAYAKVSGRSTVIYPSGGTHKELDPSITTWTTDEPLTLTPGGFYYIRIAALNAAGLTAVHDTNGLIVDPSAAEWLYVHAGVLAGETEEVIDGYVWHNNPEGILGSWKAIDPESGVTEYRVSVGTAEGDDSILPATSVGSDLDRFISGLSLDLTDRGTNTPVYYINAVAINGAGMISEMKSSSPIIVVKADQAGVVWDGAGPDIGADESYMSGHYSVTLHFSGFESELNGISHYMWALGTCPRCDNVKVFSGEGIITDDNNARGLGGSGQVYETLQLEHGVTYYSTVRAITGDGSALDSSSDGFTIDSTSPQVSLAVLGPTTDEDYTEVLVVYRQSGAVEIQPGFGDLESGISEVWLSVGSYKGGADIVASIPANDTSAVMYEARAEGLPTYLSVSAVNGAGLMSSSSAPIVLVDQSPPEAGTVTCPMLISKTEIHCSWSGITDIESGIAKHVYGIGTTEGLTDIVPLTEIDREETSFTVSSNGDFPLTHNAVYYATVFAFNNVGLQTVVYSNGMRVDNTPPESGWVIELRDYVEVDALTETVQQKNYTEAVTEDMDILCQRDITKVEIAWQEFTDPESGVNHYEVSLGSTPGGTQIHDFVRVEGDLLRHTFYPVDLSAVRQVFASVRGFNTVGLFSVAVSKGVYISRHSSGLPPLSTLQVLDGKEVVDMDYQYDNDRLYAHWDLRGDPCPAVSLKWTIHKFDGTQPLPSQSIPLTTEYAEEDGIIMHDGDSFFVELRVTNALGYSYSIHSDGLTIRLQPLMPGVVKDGPMNGVDLNFQSSTDTLSVNYDGFGSDKDPESFTDDAPDTVSADLGPHQDIAYYEIAMGTDRRYPSTRDNIHPFVNVGLNKTWTFYHLVLVPKTAYYFATVRAHSLSSSVSEVTSNGIRVGFGGGVAVIGEVRLNDYVTRLDEVSLAWSEFIFLVPVLRYFTGIKAGMTEEAEFVDCTDMIVNDDNTGTIPENFTAMFDVDPLTDRAINTFVQIGNLSLVQGAMYTAFVVALDGAGTCIMVHKSFKVDITPPTEGRVGIGPDLDLAVLYVPSTEELTVWWENYTDPESELMEYDISLMLGSDCDNFDPRQMSTVVESQAIGPGTVNFTYLGLGLQTGLPYYVILQATNNAKLTTQTVSRPIIADMAPPTSGSVVDGSVYQSDRDFHGDQNRFEGRILYLPDPSAEACPYRRYPMTSQHDTWQPIVHKGIWNLPSDRADHIVFTEDQISYGDDGVTITMKNDITAENQILSGALYADANIAEGAFYEFEIQAASEMNAEMYAVTSVAVVDWNQGIMADFNSPITSGDKEDQQQNSPEASTEDDVRYTVVADPLTGDSYPKEYAMKKPVQENSFGFHIVKDQEGDYHVILWALTINSSRYLDLALNEDPTTDFHMYTLKVNDGYNPSTKDDWSLKLYIDGALKGEITGISSVGENATLVFGLYNNHGLMVETANVFHAPKTTAKFRNLRFSAESDQLCRYGDPFIGGDHPIVEFYAGIGSEAGLDDVVTFKEVNQPCIPCGHACDDKICDPDCDPSSVQLIEIVLDELQIELIDDIQIDNITLPAVYYLSVKGITGSGKVALASSNGVYLDITPPIIQQIMHIDYAHNDYEPSDYQGSNDTIAVYVRADDDESEIARFSWAIGTSPFGTDIQDFVNVGLEDFMQNDQLEGILESNRTYYVTLEVENTAGLVTTNTSEGVTTMFETPDFANTPTAIAGTTPIGDPDANTVESSSQDSIEVSWDKPAPSKVKTVYCAVETDESDIVPEIPCGGDGAGTLKVDSEGVSMNGGDKANLSSIQQRKKRSSSQLQMEPGKVFKPDVKGCNLGNICAKFAMSTVIIRRPTDNMLAPGTDGKMTGRIRPNFDGSIDYIDLSTPEEQDRYHYLIVGSLSASDFETEYKSEASSDYTSFIVNPAATIQNTGRELRGRIMWYPDEGFFITFTPDASVSGPVQITVKYASGYFSRSGETGRPTLLTWCEVERIWADVSKSCDGEYIASVDWENNVFTTPLCDITSICSEGSNGQSRRRKRQTAGSGNNGFGGSGSFLVVGTAAEVLNDPPVIITDTTYTINEDAGTISFSIAAEDPDADDIVFLLDPDSEHQGDANLSPAGAATYKPCEDCFGTDEVTFIVREVRDDDLTPLETKGTIRVDITEINDNPVLISVLQGDVSIGTITRIVDEFQDSEFYSPLRIVIMSYDADLDSISLTINGNSDGTVLVYGQVTAVNQTFPNCVLDWSLREGEWDLALESIFDQQDFTLPVPCGIEEEVEGKSLNWVATVVEYTPNKDFLGMDTVQVMAQDEHGLVSAMLSFNIYVAANPCENNATCIGPSWDVTCSDVGRVNGFENYTCGCSPGFTGSVCEQDIDECLSSPCPTNYTCVDQTNSYQCICQDDKQCNVTVDSSDNDGLDSWLIGVISGSVVLVVVLAIGTMFCVYKLCTKPSYHGDAEPLFHRQEHHRRHFWNKPRDHPKTQLIDRNGRPLQVVGTRVISPAGGHSSGHENRAYDSTGDYHGRSRSLEPKSRTRRDEPRVERVIHLQRASSSASTGDYGRQLTKPARRWAPGYVKGTGSLYRAETQPITSYTPEERHRNVVPKNKRLRHTHSMSDGTPEYEMYRYA